jgi:hypothetical protein
MSLKATFLAYLRRWVQLSNVKGFRKPLSTTFWATLSETWRPPCWLLVACLTVSNTRFNNYRVPVPILIIAGIIPLPALISHFKLTQMLKSAKLRVSLCTYLFYLSMQFLSFFYLKWKIMFPPCRRTVSSCEWALRTEETRSRSQHK